jgi:hypothetical protein
MSPTSADFYLQLMEYESHRSRDYYEPEDERIIQRVAHQSNIAKSKISSCAAVTLLLIATLYNTTKLGMSIVRDEDAHETMSLGIPLPNRLQTAYVFTSIFCLSLSGVILKKTVSQNLDIFEDKTILIGLLAASIFQTGCFIAESFPDYA